MRPYFGQVQEKKGGSRFGAAPFVVFGVSVFETYRPQSPTPRMRALLSR